VLQFLSQTKFGFDLTDLAIEIVNFILVWTNKFYCFGCQNLIRTMPIDCIEWQKLPRTIATRVDQKQVSDIVFSMKTQATEEPLPAHLRTRLKEVPSSIHW